MCLEIVILILLFSAVVNLTLIDLPGLTKVAVGRFLLVPPLMFCNV